MTDPARKADPPLPSAVADALEVAGFSPQVESLLRIIAEFGRLQREKAAEPAAEPSEEKLPLKRLLPDGVKYERARRAAEAGRLVAEKIGDTRWVCTKSAMALWAATIGWLRS